MSKKIYEVLNLELQKMAYSKALLLLGLSALSVISQVSARKLAETTTNTMETSMFVSLFSFPCVHLICFTIVKRIL